MAPGLSPFQVNIPILLSFMEYLCRNGQSRPNIANYMASRRAFHRVYGLET